MAIHQWRGAPKPARPRLGRKGRISASRIASPLAPRAASISLSGTSSRSTSSKAARRLVASRPLAIDLAILLADLPGAQLIDPDRLHDTKHPAIEARPLLELLHSREGALASGLHEVVGLGHGPGQATGEAPQTGQ